MKRTLDSVKHEVVHVTCFILDKNKLIFKCTDICFTNTLRFIGTIRQVNFDTIQHIVNRRKKTNLSSLTTVCRIYGARGFTVKINNVDNEFECLREDLWKLLSM